MKRYLLPIVVEMFGIMVVSAGIGIEIAMRADLGFLLITSGSVVIAAGGILWAKFVRVTRP